MLPHSRQHLARFAKECRNLAPEEEWPELIKAMKGHGALDTVCKSGKDLVQGQYLVLKRRRYIYYIQKLIPYNKPMTLASVYIIEFD